MRRSLEIAFISIVLICRLPIQQVSAEVPPGGVLAPQAGGYVFVKCPGVFDALNDEGITVEFWFYLTDAPEDWRDRWVLLSKPGSYSFYIRGPRTGPDWWPINDPAGTVNFYCRTLSGGGAEGSMQNPLQCWHHFAFQFRVTKFDAGTSEQRATFFDGMTSSKGSGYESRVYLPDDLLFIGGRPGYGSLKGWIDEVRISSIWRYTPGEIFKPERESSRDQYTLALWHFNEGDWARQYEDSSGNGYTLLGGGTMLVDRKNRLITAWGSLKDSERY